MNEIEKNELWMKFCKEIRWKLNKIVAPVIDTHNRSRQAYEDVITNVILFEMNIDRKPWELIPQREVKLPNDQQLLDDLFRSTTKKVLCQHLMKIIRSDVSYQDREIEDISSITLQETALYIALKNFVDAVGDDY